MSKISRKIIVFLPLLVLVSCQTKTANCPVANYVSTSIENRTSADLEVTFCSSETVVPTSSKIVPASSPMSEYSTTVSEDSQPTKIPYSDSEGDGCSKMGVSSKYVGEQVPLLKTEDLLTTKTCNNNDNNFIFVAVGQACPSGYSDFDQGSFSCKGE